MGDVHGLLLRPARAQGGVRPAARRGGPAAKRLAVALSLALTLLPAAPARADTLDAPAYRGLVEQACALARSGRLDDARRLLARVDAVRTAEGTVAVDDRGFDEGACARRLASLDALARPVDGAAADAKLASALADLRARGGAATLPVVIGALLDRWLRSLPLPDLSGLAFATRFLIAIPLVLALLLVLGRGVRERLRREDVLPALRASRHGDPWAHLRAADEALAAGRGRDAVHALYLYALTSLASREAIRYDPALTDRELLGRAAALPRVDALRELFALHERVWFGLREPRPDDGERARGLALAVAP